MLPDDTGTGALKVHSRYTCACGLVGSAYTKFGRSEAGSLNVSARHFTFGDGLSRLGNHVVSAMVVVKKDGRITGERLVARAWRPNPQTPRGDGDDEVITTAEGMFENFAAFFPK